MGKPTGKNSSGEKVGRGEIEKEEKLPCEPYTLINIHEER